MYVVRGERKAESPKPAPPGFLPAMRVSTSITIILRWRQPYIGRRRQTGFGLYGLLGVDRSDTASVQNYRVQNYQFFGAPVGLFFTIDRDMEQGSWLDYGMFLQSFMLAAREVGLESCAQAAFCPYHDSVMPILEAPPDQMLVCGMSLGYADPDALVNTYRTERLDASEFLNILE